MTNTPSDDSVTLKLDGQPHVVPAGTTLAALVASLGHAEDAVATALNQDFISKQQRPVTLLQPGDDVLMFQPIVGG